MTGAELRAALRRAATAALPRGAFLRRDRGDALFVTDAPRRMPGADWQALFAPHGFDARPEGTLLRLTPGPAWIDAVEAAFPDPPDALSASLSRFRGLPPDPESLALFAMLTRALDAGESAAKPDRPLRQRAATVLRLNARGDPPQGGGLYACAVVVWMLYATDCAVV